MHQYHIDHGSFVDNQEVESSRFDSFFPNRPDDGSASKSRWIVFASIPMDSVIRLAARPVGAQRRQFTPLARTIPKSELTNVVLPTPGPPVMTLL